MTLKNHPFAVEAYFERSTVLSFAIAKEEIEHLIPSCLTLDTFQDKWAFIAVAMVQTKDLRPKGMPKAFGRDFFLIGYRIFVRYKDERGKNLRGLYIIKSETDSKLMEIAGNAFTHYNYSTTDINMTENEATRQISSEQSRFSVSYNDDEGADLPVHSPFTTWKEARRFAGPLPFTFTVNEDEKTVLIIQGVRQNWKPRPVSVLNHNFEFLNKLNLKSIELANAFVIEEI